MIALLGIGFFAYTHPVFAMASSSEVGSTDVYMRGIIEQIVKEDIGTELGETLITQNVAVRIISGGELNTRHQIDYQIRGEKNKKLKVGDEVVVDKNSVPGAINYYITEPFRLPAVTWLLIIFIVITVIFARMRGLMAFVGLGLTLLIIGMYVIPHIAQGDNPFLVSIIGTALIASSSLFLAHGFTRETWLAFVSIMITICGAMGLSYAAVHFTHLYGMGSEEAYYLQFSSDRAINVRGLLLGGIIIGVLGILDDVATAQVAAVSELKKANPTLTGRELYHRAARIGREHITSVVNTLVLAYVGASFPLLLLFTVYPTPWWVTLNTELLSEEVVRTLIGSIVLVAAVPLSTFIAARYYSNRLT
jgi:uncharacterized membrane protein